MGALKARTVVKGSNVGLQGSMPIRERGLALLWKSRPPTFWREGSCSSYQTAVFVIRMYGGVGGGNRETSPYPD